MKQKELSQEESLQVIQGMIDLAKNKISDSGFHFLLWGGLVILASLTQYFMIKDGWQEESNLVWGIMPLIGIPAAFIYERRRQRTHPTHSKFDRMYGYLWLGFGITTVITIYVNVSNGINPIPSIMLLVGLATFVSGAIYRFLPLTVGAVVFWISSIICTELNGPEQLLMNAVAIFIGYIIPGLLLWKKAKMSVHV